MLERRNSLLAAFIVSAALVTTAVIAARTVLATVRIRHHDRIISVTGSVRRRIRSDLVIWRADIATRAPTLREAYAALATDVARARAFLVAHGINADAITTTAITTEEHRERVVPPALVRQTVHACGECGDIPEQVVAYSLTQVVEVTSSDVDRVTQVSRDVTELINQGVTISSAAPVYLYTRLGELKIELLAGATRDATLRAEQVARNSHSRLGPLSNARMGVIQVNAANETNVSAEGVNDTTSLEKDALAVISVVFYTE